jgi:hypothetical protein
VAPLDGVSHLPELKDGSEVRMFLTDFEPPVRLLEVGDSGGAQLQVTVSGIASAAESEFLPDIYKPLYCS